MLITVFYVKVKLSPWEGQEENPGASGLSGQTFPLKTLEDSLHMKNTPLLNSGSEWGLFCPAWSWLHKALDLNGFQTLWGRGDEVRNKLLVQLLF